MLKAAAAATVLPAPLAGTPEVFRGEPNFEELPDSGLIAFADGESEDGPDVSLSPVTYFFNRPVTITVAIAHRSDVTRRAGVEAILAAISAQLDVDDTLGGVVDMAEAEGPVYDDDVEPGSEPIRSAEFSITLDYDAPSPLG
jgi:hypothetical protein